MQSLRESKQAFSPTSRASEEGVRLSPQVTTSFAGLDMHDNIQGSVLRGCTSLDCLRQVLPCSLHTAQAPAGIDHLLKCAIHRSFRGPMQSFAFIAKLEMSLQCAETSGAAAKDP